MQRILPVILVTILGFPAAPQDTEGVVDIETGSPFPLPGKAGDSLEFRLPVFCSRMSAPFPPSPGPTYILSKSDPRLQPLMSQYHTLRHSRSARLELLKGSPLFQRIIGIDSLYCWIAESSTARRIVSSSESLASYLDANRRLLDVLLCEPALHRATQIAIWAVVEEQDPDAICEQQWGLESDDVPVIPMGGQADALQCCLMSPYATLLLQSVRPQTSSRIDPASPFPPWTARVTALQKAYLRAFSPKRLVNLARSQVNPHYARACYHAAARVTHDLRLMEQLRRAAQRAKAGASTSHLLPSECERKADRAYRLILSDRQDQAIQLLSEVATQRGPAAQRATYAYLRGMARAFAGGDPQIALADLNQALEAMPRIPQCRERVQLTRALMDRLLHQPPFEDHYRSAVSEMIGGNRQRAAEHLRAALSELNGQVDARCLLANLLRHMGRYDRAAAELQSVREQAPYNVRALAELAQLATQRGHTTQAQQHRARAADIDADSAALQLYRRTSLDTPPASNASGR